MIEPTTSRAEMVGVRLAEVVVLDDLARSAGRSCRPAAGNARATSLAKRVGVVVEPQPHAGKRDLGADLRRDREVVPRHPQLPQQPRERAGLRALGRDVGERVQADVVVAAAEAIERIQPADRVVPLENADPLVVVRQPNPGRQPATSPRR